MTKTCKLKKTSTKNICTPHKGDMSDNCSLSVKNRCVLSNSFKKMSKENKNNVIPDYIQNIDSFKNLTLKHNEKAIEQSINILLENNQIEVIQDSDNNKHIVLSKHINNIQDLTPIDRLFVFGVTTIPILNKTQLNKTRNDLIVEMQNFPEYKRDISNPNKTPDGFPIVYVLGGFGAFGNPSSFHNKTVRELRQKTYIQCRNRLFREVIDKYKKSHSEDYLLEVLLDRFMYRLKGTAPTAEKWHRDVAHDDLIEDNDEILGGWINLDNESQYFSCIPGSHLNVRLKGLKDGFATIKKTDINLFKEYKQVIEVKPGHCIIFPQYILHEVVSKKQSYDMMRLFIGWRITRSLESLYTNNFIEKLLKNQSSPLLPSGQKPPIYSASHSMFFQKKDFMIHPEAKYKTNICKWSISTFKDSLLKENKIVERYLGSLEDSGFVKYPEYSKEEKKIYFPHSL